MPFHNILKEYDTSWGLDTDSQTIQSESGDVSLTIEGLSGLSASAGGLVQLGMQRLGVITLGSEDHSMELRIDLSSNEISLVLGGTMELSLNGVEGSIGIYLGDAGIKIMPGPAIGFQIDASTCISPKQIYEIIKYIFKVLELIQGVLPTGIFPAPPGMSVILCESTWTSPI